jgi:HEAT repeat protein
MEDLHALLHELNVNNDEQVEQVHALLINYAEAALPVINELLNSTDSEKRALAISALSHLHHPATQPALFRGLSDPDLVVRYSALLGLRRQPNPTALPALVQFLCEEDPLLARLTTDSLIALGEDSIPSLVDILESQQPHGRIEAARALALIDHEDVIQPLLKALGDRSMLVDYWAREGLNRRGLGLVYFSQRA